MCVSGVVVCFVCDLLCDVVWLVNDVCVCVALFVCFVCGLLCVVAWCGGCVVFVCVGVCVCLFCLFVCVVCDQLCDNLWCVGLYVI